MTSIWKNREAIWKNRHKILEGILNTVFKKEYIEDIANIRQAECNECDELDVEGKSCICLGTQPCCKICGCGLEFKTRSLSSSCDLNKWKSLMSQEDEDKLMAE